MSEEIKQIVDSNSAEFKEGVESGLNSAEDTKNWKAGNEPGQELKAESETREPVYRVLFKKTSTPVFLLDGPEGAKGNAQDEKNEAEE
jgi:hypothetical protein